MQMMVKMEKKTTMLLYLSNKGGSEAQDPFDIDIYMSVVLLYIYTCKDLEEQGEADVDRAYEQQTIYV